ncbi:amidase domain-containing protein [Rummeliibacillus suwonensis]|uniref:amidase domain-containing protein n=1 Tax=Rummeliibacillus suwonensis TaxID=1306154 RepID=UPI0011B37BEC|nr:amidase domain-containing protein [Rummeliibacillus suwonensis]
MKKIICTALAFSVALSGITPIFSTQAKAKSKSVTVQELTNELNAKERNDYTLKEAESLFVNFLKSKNINFEVGSKEFTDYAITQFYSDDIDEDLLNTPHYDVITAYISEYVYAYETTIGTIDNEILDNLIKPSLRNTLNSDVFADIAIDDEKKDFNERLNIQKQKTIGEIEHEIANDETGENENKTNRLITLASTYSVSKAKAYAKKWYDGRNSSYEKYSNDCTNFTSQILRAGGKSMKKPSTINNVLNHDTDYWYYTQISRVGTLLNARSTSWSVVSDFYAYWSQKQSTKSSTSKSTLISYADEGDMIQFKKEGYTRYSHTMFVYDKADGTLYLSGHTDNYLKRNFKNISKAWVKYRVIKF